MGIQFFLLVVDAFPGPNVDEESLILIERDLDSLSKSSVIAFKELCFMTTLLINSSYSEPTLGNFKVWWLENMQGEISLECIAEERGQLADCRASDLDQLEVGGWSLQSSFIAYSARSAAAYREARELIFESELRW